MELKTYFAQDRNGNLIPSATVSIFLSGTSTLATGLKTVSGANLTNPFTAGSDGKIQFYAPDGIYDMQVSLGSVDGVKVTFQCIDVQQQLSEASSAADRAETAAEYIESQSANIESNSREQWRRSLADAGITLVNGSFEAGATVSNASEAVWHIAGGQCYTWGGVIPKVVTEGSTPSATGGVSPGAWTSVGNKSFSQSLASNKGMNLIGDVDSVAQLASVSGASVGDKILVRSYIAGSNKGGGTFVAVENTETPDGVVVFDGVGVKWRRLFFAGEVNVFDAGYTGSGDIAVYINKVNSAGYDCLIPCSGAFSSAIEIDFSKGSVRGVNKCTLTEIEGIPGDYALKLFNSNTDYADRDSINANAILDGVAFQFSGTKKIALGGAGTGELSELRISNFGFISSAGLEFLDNSYRIIFDKGAISRSFNDTLIFNSPANSGEVINFNHCWMVDNGGPLKFKNGQFIFNGCSMPAGKKAGYFDPNVILEDNATVVYSNGNIEFQPGQSFVAFVVGGSSRLSIKDSTLLTPSGYSAIPIVANDDAVVSLTNCSLPLYEQTQIASGAAARQIIGGNSKKVMSYGCYPRAGFITANWDKGNIVSAYINSLSNGSGQFSNYSNWSLMQTGSGVVTAGTDTDVPNSIMFSRSLYVTVPSFGATADFYQDCLDCSPGRYFQLGFWAKNAVTSLASIEFFDKEGNSVQGKIPFNIPSVNAWGFYALVDIVPPGASKARVNFAVSGEVGTLHIHNAIYGLI